MPKLDMFKPGDVVFPQYGRIKLLEIAANVGITKGNLYTTDNTGRLIEPPAAADGYFQRGIYQAMRTVAANAKAGENKVQVLAAGSRALLLAESAATTAGDKVFWAGTNKVDLITAANAVLATHVFRIVGRIWGVYTRGTSTFTEEDGKRVAAAGDAVFVDLGLI